MNSKKITALVELLTEGGSTKNEIKAIVKLKKEEESDKKWENIRSWSALLISIFAIVVSVTNANPDSTVNDSTVYSDINTEISQHPTQDEWLKVYISHNIHELTDLWQLRVAANVVVITQNSDSESLPQKEMIITIVSANGEDAISVSAKDQYIQFAENVAKSILVDYGVEDEYKLIVQCL